MQGVSKRANEAKGGSRPAGMRPPVKIGVARNFHADDQPAQLEGFRAPLPTVSSMKLSQGVAPKTGNRLLDLHVARIYRTQASDPQVNLNKVIDAYYASDHGTYLDRDEKELIRLTIVKHEAK